MVVLVVVIGVGLMVVAKKWWIYIFRPEELKYQVVVTWMGGDGSDQNIVDLHLQA